MDLRHLRPRWVPECVVARLGFFALTPSGRLPLELSVQLRANREDGVLLDSHGQIWNELVSLVRHDTLRFQGNAKQVEEQMVKALCLKSHGKFPSKRLGTLWRNEQWRSVITELCQFSFGRNLFNISTFEWMSSCRLDDVSFTCFCLWFSFLAPLTIHFWGAVALVCPSS